MGFTVGLKRFRLVVGRVSKVLVSERLGLIIVTARSSTSLTRDTALSPLIRACNPHHNSFVHAQLLTPAQVCGRLLRRSLHAPHSTVMMLTIKMVLPMVMMLLLMTMMMMMLMMMMMMMFLLMVIEW